MSENKNAKTPTDDGQVAHVYLFDKTGRPMVAWDNAKDIKLGDKLYAAPKQWVGLTADEIWECNKAKSGAEEAINDLREVIAYSERQEPFCYHDGVNQVDAEFKDHSDVFPLYLAAPQREWVGLTDEEIWGSGSRLSLSESGIREFARAIEAKLKEKNT